VNLSCSNSANYVKDKSNLRKSGHWRLNEDPCTVAKAFARLYETCRKCMFLILIIVRLSSAFYEYMIIVCKLILINSIRRSCKTCVCRARAWVVPCGYKTVKRLLNSTRWNQLRHCPKTLQCSARVFPFRTRTPNGVLQHCSSILERQRSTPY